MTADLTPAQAARLQAIEAALHAELVSLWPFVLPELDQVADVLTRADAAIDVMRGATENEAIGRVLAECDAAENRWPDFSPAGDPLPAVLTTSEIRAAVGAPATAEGDDRG